MELFADDRKSCGKVFNNLSKFHAHLRVHTNELPYACSEPGCYMRFSQKGNMKTHVRRCHPIGHSNSDKVHLETNYSKCVKRKTS